MSFQILPGDVIRCPGYPSVEKPARIPVVADDHVFEPLNEGESCGPVFHVTRANEQLKKYGRHNKAFGGSFWAIERDGVQVFPEVSQ